MKIGTYQLTKKEKEAVEAFTGICGFDLMEGTDPVTDRKSFKECLKMNSQWIYDMANDAIKKIDAIAYD